MSLYANKIFPWVLDATEPKEMAEQRRLLLKDIKGEILEIGIGTGVNLPYYPEHVRKLTVIEPSDAMRPRARIRAGKLGKNIEWYQARGERMPFNEGYFDCVVCVDVLCSVDDVDAVLKESYRVLKPEGRLYFLEHGISEAEKIRKWQIRLNSLSKVIACGCQLTRDIEGHIRKSNFVIVEMVHVAPFSGMNELYTHIRGVAIKERSKGND